jgi:hypothetical protein
LALAHNLDDLKWFSDKGVLTVRSILQVIFIAAVVLTEPSFAQKLVDPNAVAPEYREAAEKRRAEQIKQRECASKADAAKVPPRDRIAYINACLAQDGQSSTTTAAH